MIKEPLEEDYIIYTTLIETYSGPITRSQTDKKGKEKIETESAGEGSSQSRVETIDPARTLIKWQSQYRNNNGNDSHNNQNSGNGNRQRKHSIDKGKLQYAGCEKAPKALREKLLKTKEEKSKSSPFSNNNSQSSTGSKPKELIAMADGTAFRTAIAQPNYDDRIAIIDTARIDVGHYFPFASTKEREYTALFRCLTDHIARGDGISRTYILTTRPDPSTWEQSNNREIRIAQEMVREAVNRGSIILKDREGHTLRDDPEPWGEKPENHIELYHLVKDMYGVHNAPTAFLRRVIEIGQALDNETQAATDTNNQSANTNNDQGHIEKGPTNDDSANNYSTGENPISNLSNRNSITNAPPQINSKGGQARYRGLGQRVCEGEDHYGQEAVLLDQKMMTCYIGSTKEITGKDTVLLDSGADICLFKDKKWFNTLRPLDVNIGSINRSASLKIKGGGNVRLILLAADGTETPITLTDVAYSPGARSNIVSLSQLATKGNLQGSWDKNQITILAEGRNVGQAIRVNGLYLLQLQKKTNIVAMADAFASLVTITVTKAAILKKIKSGEVCPVCAVTRATVKIPRDPATRREEEFGFLFHADTWGPYPIEGFDSTRYFLFVTDDAKRFTFAAPISVKANLPKIFKRLHKTIEKTYNIKIRGYRFDNEFWKGPIRRWLAAPTNAQLSRIITKKALEYIRQSSLPANLWPEAIKYAIWHKNRAPSRALRRSYQNRTGGVDNSSSDDQAPKTKKGPITPWEALNRHKPDLSKDSIWGSRVYVTIPPETRDRRKLHQPRGWVRYFQEDVSEEGEQPQEEDNLELYQQDDVKLYDDFPDDSPFIEPENPFPNPLPSNSPTSSDPMNNENDENTPPQRVTSRFFGSTVILAKRQRTPSESEASSEISKTSSTDEDEPNKKRKKKKRSDHDNRTKWKKRMRFSKDKVCGKCLEDGGHYFFDEDTDPEWPEVRPACVRCKKLPGAPGNKCRVITDPEEIKACKAINAQRNKRGISLRSAGKRPKRIGVKKEFKCSRCAKRRLACDGKIPCETCTTKGIPCRKQDTEKDEKSTASKREQTAYGMLNKDYLPESGPLGKAYATDFNPAKKGKKLNNLRLCIYKNEEDGCFEKWNVSAFTLDENDRPQLKDDWEEHSNREARKRVLKANETSFRSKTLSMSKEVNEESSQLHETTPITEARRQLATTFPDGWVTIPTEANELMCGLYAIRHSLQHQLPHLDVPTIQDLLDIYRELATQNLAFEMDNENMFRADQLAAILREFGRRQQQSIDLQLGYVLANGLVALVFPEETDSTTLWIHNTNDQADSWRNAHWEGMATKNHQHNSNEQSEEDNRDDKDADDSISSMSEEEKKENDNIAAFSNPTVMSANLESMFLEMGLSDCDDDDNSTDYSEGIATEKPIDANIETYAPQHQISTARRDTRKMPDPESYAEAIRAPDAANSEQLQLVKDKLNSAFKMKDEGPVTYYLGLNVKQSDEGIRIHQKAYTKQILRRFELQHYHNKKVPIQDGTTLSKNQENPDERLRTEYQRKAGSISFLAGQTRPDIGFATNLLARYNSNPSKEHMAAMNNLFAYVKGTISRGIMYRKGKTELAGFSDSDHAGYQDTARSTTSWIFILASAPISWSSQRQKAVSISTTEAEYIAAAEAAKEAI
ncbi:hypothetical protein CPAR01_16776 [Colletotrichum paranaense]|uniref:Zn(2)-C6 fungal-type domain-containing protein n=1 Tax=Colletotrichum paranaense TaxID=1914294 RepID=A0ABQ9RV50_9PEZI|nr:uncharacterized protein CPAR01_16776 [Colletotrichum paranaense]KAK1515355.1 hypothetical protein CPAR01_16776 [Colletotrichum paranaense]